MVHGYHLILTNYGFWLPNDPRGSWSEVIRKWELVRFGRASKSIDRRGIEELTDEERHQRSMAANSLSYPPVHFNGAQAASVANGFAAQARKSNYTVWACSILPEHTHLVIARHRYASEQIANLLKGAATRRIIADQRHPLAGFAKPGHRPPRMWAEHQWIVYLDSEQAIDNAIRYVEENAPNEGRPVQSWKFVTPFAGLPKSGWVTYHSR